MYGVFRTKYRYSAVALMCPREPSGHHAVPSTEPPPGMRRQRGEPSCAPGHGYEPRTCSATAGRGWNLRPSRAERMSKMDHAASREWPPRPGRPGAGIATGAAALETIAGVFVSPGPQSPPSRNTVRLEPRRATRRGGDRTPAPRVSRPRKTPLAGACARNLQVIWPAPAVSTVPSLMS